MSYLKYDTVAIVKFIKVATTTTTRVIGDMITYTTLYNNKRLHTMEQMCVENVQLVEDAKEEFNFKPLVKTVI